MTRWILAAGLFAGCAIGHAEADVWQPAAGLVQTPLWPGTPPDAAAVPGPETAETGASLIGGKTVVAIRNVAAPTMTVYPPQGRNTGTAVVVFPGGGFEILAMDLEGTDVCDWLTARGITCVLLKYRVPSLPYDWHCDCRAHNFALSLPALDDAQRALRLVRAHAGDWRIDPHRVGVIGFSAGGYLVAETSTRFERKAPPGGDAADRESSRPDFALAIYPGHITADGHRLNRNLTVSPATPPTFILQAQDDHVDGVDQALVYYTALKDAGVSSEIHIYPNGGHAFGLRPTAVAITRWPALAETWLVSIGMLPGVP